MDIFNYLCSFAYRILMYFLQPIVLGLFKTRPIYSMLFVTGRLASLSIHTALSDSTQTGLFCRVWCGDVNSESARQPDRCVQCRSVSGGAVRPLDALRRRTHLSGGQFTPPHQTRQDCRACLSTAAVTQARQTATPSRPTAHTQRRCTPRKM